MEITAAISDKSELIHTAGRISAACVALYAARMDMIVVGIICREAVLMTVKIHISEDGFFGLGFILSSSSIAAIPAGVAALPIPKIFAVIFAVMSFEAFPPLFSFGKSLCIIGEKNFSAFDVTPLRSAISSIPDQKHISPVKDRTTSVDFFAASNIAAAVCEVVPFANDIKKAADMHTGHIRFIEIPPKNFIIILLINLCFYDKIK